MINLNKKIFKALSNSDNGEVGNDTVFHYSQKGNLIGKQLKDGKFDFVYHHINVDGNLKIGKCLSHPVLLENGKIKLFEKWQWLNGDLSDGISELIEIN